MSGSKEKRTLLDMTSEEIYRHQQAGASYIGPDDPWHGFRIGTFPMPNRRRTGISVKDRLAEIDYEASVMSAPQVQLWGPDQTRFTALAIDGGILSGHTRWNVNGAQMGGFLGPVPDVTGDLARQSMLNELIMLKTRLAELETAKRRREQGVAQQEMLDPRSATDGLAPPPMLPPTGPTFMLHTPVSPFSSRLGVMPAPTPSVPSQSATHGLPPDANLDALFSLMAEIDDASMRHTQPGLSHDDANGTVIKHPREESEPEEPSSSARTKRSKRPINRGVIEHHAACLSCAESLVQVMVRLPKAELPQSMSISLRCLRCTGISPEPSEKTLEQRKRSRAKTEQDHPSRVFCDVCQRGVAVGRILNGDSGQDLTRQAEVVCWTCHEKYQRCTDCGGGGGSRLGVGKWRLKQVFTQGRKTCNLSHRRVGGRERHIGVYETPTDFTPTELDQVVKRCRAMCIQKVLSRLAVPEFVEYDEPGSLHTFAGIEEMMMRRWPMREATLRAVGVDLERFKRFLCLIWTPTKSRRSKDAKVSATGMMDDRPSSDGAITTDAVVPPNCDLIGLWGAEWDMQQGSLLLSTLVPFDSADGEDGAATAATSKALDQVERLREEINAERMDSTPPHWPKEQIPPCEHLWVVANNTLPLVQGRILDTLTKKLSFVPLDKYLETHPSFIHAVQARPRGLHHRSQASGSNSDPLILVRHLGDSGPL